MTPPTSVTSRPRAGVNPVAAQGSAARRWPGGAHHGSSSLEDAVAAGLGGEVGVVAGRSVILGRRALASVSRAGIAGVLVVAVGDRGHARGGAGGHTEVVVEVAVVVAVARAADAALADPAVVDHRGGLDLVPGPPAEDVQVLAEEHRPRLVLAVVRAGLAAGLEVGGGRGAVEHQVHLADRASGQPRLDRGGGGGAVVDTAGLAPVLAVILGVGQVHVLIVGPGCVHVAGAVDRDHGELVAEVGRGVRRLVDDVVGERQRGDAVDCGGHADRHVRGVERRAGHDLRRAGGQPTKTWYTSPVFGS